MKTLQKVLCCLILCIFAINLTACETDNTLDLTAYFKDSIKYELADNNNTEGDFELSKIINSSSDLNKYTRIEITSKQDWTYGLEIERIEFDVLLSIPADVDIEITITNLENGEHLNEVDNTFFYSKTLSINKENTSVKLDINDVFTKKASVIELKINKSCYQGEANKDLKIGVANLKMYGQHKEAHY